MTATLDCKQRNKVIDFVQGMRREEESKSLMRRNRVQHIAYCLKPTAHWCHNYYIGLLEALCEHETIRDVFENIVHFSSQDGHTINEKDARRQAALVWA
jgi:hypothetical protein